MCTPINFNSSYEKNVELKTIATIEVQEIQCQWKLKVKNWSLPVNLPDFHKNVTTLSPVFGGSGHDLNYDHHHSWKLQWTERKVVKTNSRGVQQGKLYCQVELILASLGEGYDYSCYEKIKAKAFISLQETGEFCHKDMQFLGLSVGETLSTLKISGADLFNKKNGYVVNDVVTVHCRILIGPHGSPIYKISDEPKFKKARRRSAAERIMKSALMSHEFADIQLVTLTKSFPGHRAILAARSPVFAAMFRSDMREAKNSSVVIQDFDEVAIESMLEYIYTGQVTKLEVNAMDLLRISDKYELTELKEECEEFLCSNLKIKNFVEVWHLASLLNAAALKDSSARFIIRNKEKVSETEGFRNLSRTNPDVVIEFFVNS